MLRSNIGNTGKDGKNARKTKKKGGSLLESKFSRIGGEDDPVIHAKDKVNREKERALQVEPRRESSARKKKKEEKQEEGRLEGT